jgi:two-component system, NarL family, response regulator YdfI
LTRVVIAASSAITRAGLAALLMNTGEIDVIGSVAQWNEYSGEEPDVVVADWDEGGELSWAAVDSGPAPAIILLVDDPAVPWIVEALRSGVRAVLPRGSTASQIVSAIEAVAAGLIVLQPGDLDGLLVNPRRATILEPLTPREIEVLGMLADGRSNKVIAHQLGISEHTVKFHVTSILSKLNAGSRTEAVTLGIRQGLILI